MLSLIISAVRYTVEALSTNGDVNGDGVVNIIDATFIQKYIAGIDSFTEKQESLADVNNDGLINIIDATSIQKYCAGISSDF